MAEPGIGMPPTAGDGSAIVSDFRRFAGRALFPRSPAELTDTSRCPACYTALLGPVCRECRLDVSNPAAAKIATLSRDAAALLDQRLAVIGRIRYETSRAVSAAAQSAATTVAETVHLPIPQTAPRPFPLAATPHPLAAPRTAPSPTAPSPTAVPPAPGIPPRHSSVQVILLIVGISLLSVAAIFFLVYAFINFGILGRSLVIAAVTVASFVIASGLHRRSLLATSEGIAVLAVVLVYLDAFAIRANDFFGLARVDAAAFWGAALLVSSVGFLAWHRLSDLRTPNIVAFSAIVPGVALLVGGLTDGLSDAADDGSRTFFAFTAATLAGAIHSLTARSATGARPAFAGRPERAIVLGFTGISLVGAFVAAVTVAPQLAWAATAAYLVVSALCVLHARLVGVKSPAPRAELAAVFAGIGGISAAGAVAAGAVRTGDFSTIVVAAPIAATFIALALEWGWRRSTRATNSVSSLRREWQVATIGAATVATVTLVPPFSVAFRSTTIAVYDSLSSAWTLAPQHELLPSSPVAGSAVGALAVCVLMLAAVRATTGRVDRLARVCAFSGAAVLIVAAPLLDSLAAVYTGWLLIAVASLGALLVMDRRRFTPWLKPPLMVLVAISGVLSYLVSWGSTSIWWIGSVMTVALLLVSRMLPASPLGRATALGTSAIVVLIGTAAYARQLALPFGPDSATDLSNALRAVSIVAVALLALSGFRLQAALSMLDRRVLFWIGAVSAAVSFPALTLMDASRIPGERMLLLLPEPGTSLAVDAALLAAVLILVARPHASRLPRERLVASLALAPTLTLVMDQFARVIGLPELARSTGSIVAALLAAVGVLAVASIRTRTEEPRERDTRPGLLRSDRLLREIGVLLVATPSVITAVLRHDSVTWLVLVVAALVFLTLATSPDGLFGSSSPRRHLGWAALALATSGLWWRLGDARVVLLEPYVLPLAGVLLVIALILWRKSRPTSDSAPDPVAPAITLAALLVAILPLAAASSTGLLSRAVVLVTVSSVLVILGSAVIGSAPSRPYLDAMSLAGALGVLTVVVGRSALLGSGPVPPDLRLDAWLAAGVLVLVIAAFGQARDREDRSMPLRIVAGQVIAVLGLLVVLGFEVSAFDHTPLGTLRVIAVILLFSAVHVTSFLIDRGPFTRIVGWIAIAGAAIAVLAGLVVGALDPVELGTIPVAAALAVTGALTLSRVPTARTWPWLSPAVAVLLIPSLMATADDPPVWRLVALGVVGVAIIVASAVLRLQAPFLIAVVVVLVHAIATFAPQIRTVYESVEWWLWFVPVGIAVVVFAARFEKSLLRMRSVALRIRALR